ncbi:uncharacterized protein LOC119452341 [Dermacentor silvarum]|uniref:uncharacterized protein LOC119452341 n=1 Tax=Dermacentor silvarum TaxID=543639 RepID=UPI00189713B5|nr:uncharacterized protein LOC119452341 [Dermacentor silvarum]
MASSSSGIVSDDDSDETRTFLRSSPETTSRASYAARLAAEASQMNTQAVELDVRKVFDYLRPSRVEKFREAMDRSMLKLTISAEKAQSRLGEGHDILANRKWAKECQSTAVACA